jgi:hypothetical protein
MAGDAGSSPGTDGDWVLFIVLASDDPAVIRAVTRALDDLGIDTHVATPQGGPPLVFDYKNARYVPIALSGKLPVPGIVESTEPVPRRLAGLRLKAMLFPHSPVAVDDARFFHIKLDRRGRWVTRLVGALEFLGREDEPSPRAHGGK